MDMDFATKLKEMRKRKFLSQAELAEKIDVHYTQISRYERGVTKPSLHALKKIADALEVNPDYFMDGPTPEPEQTILHDEELLEQFREVEDMADDEKKAVKLFLDAFITKKHLQKLMK